MQIIHIGHRLVLLQLSIFDLLAIF